jgi:FtsP/CotA-like multicopper oxidase with cupredoxin domain
MSPGERYEVLVDFSDGKAVTLQSGPDVEIGLFGALTDHLDPGEYYPVVRFEPAEIRGAVKTVPTRLVDLPPANPDGAVEQRRFVLNGSMTMGPAYAGSEEPQMTINGKSHDMARIDATVSLGTTEVWEIVSTGMAHPFHVHGALFRVLSIDGEAPPPHQLGWKDVILVNKNAKILVAFDRPATPQHPFMFHCHILEHEDAGLMGQYACV